MVETIKYSFTESGANTFTEFEKALEDDIGKKRRSQKKGSTTKVMMIRAILVEWPDNAGSILEGADDDQLALQITTNSEAAIVNISDKDLFWKAEISAAGAVAAGAYVNTQPTRYIINKPYIKKTMWFGLCGTSLAAAATVHVELQFDYKYLSDWQMQRMISRKV